nr:Cyclin F-box domain containing protein [Haemonchus contortus]
MKGIWQMEEKINTTYNVPFTSKKSSKFTTRKLPRKVFEALVRLLTSIVFCCQKELNAARKVTRLEELPNEILLKIISYCDFSSKMNMRAVNHRLCALVEKRAHVLVRRNIIGGIEIRRGDGNVKEESHPFTCSSFYVTLCRPLKQVEIMVPATRLPNIMRHVCVCHSLKLCGVPLDEVLASNILAASFRAVSDVVIDRVHTVTASTLAKLIDKAYPSSKLILCNHCSIQSLEALAPELVMCCPAQDVSIEPSVALLHHMFDDSALERLVISDLAIRRNIRLPLCAITHRGISRAAQAFHKRCCDVMAELTAEMRAPKWEISVSFPSSVLIDRNLIEVPVEMRGQFTIWSFVSRYSDCFTVEVRVGGMNLKIMVE